MCPSFILASGTDYLNLSLMHPTTIMASNTADCANLSANAKLINTITVVEDPSSSFLAIAIGFPQPLPVTVAQDPSQKHPRPSPSSSSTPSPLISPCQSPSPTLTSSSAIPSSFTKETSNLMLISDSESGSGSLVGGLTRSLKTSLYLFSEVDRRMFLEDILDVKRLKVGTATSVGTLKAKCPGIVRFQTNGSDHEHARVESESYCDRHLSQSFSSEGHIRPLPQGDRSSPSLPTRPSLKPTPAMSWKSKIITIKFLMGSLCEASHIEDYRLVKEWCEGVGVSVELVLSEELEEVNRLRRKELEKSR
jgi:hypothetical protein